MSKESFILKTSYSEDKKVKLSKSHQSYHCAQYVKVCVSNSFEVVPFINYNFKYNEKYFINVILSKCFTRLLYGVENSHSADFENRWAKVMQILPVGLQFCHFIILSKIEFYFLSLHKLFKISCFL